MIVGGLNDPTTSKTTLVKGMFNYYQTNVDLQDAILELFCGHKEAFTFEKKLFYPQLC